MAAPSWINEYKALVDAALTTHLWRMEAEDVEVPLGHADVPPTIAPVRIDDDGVHLYGLTRNSDGQPEPIEIDVIPFADADPKKHPALKRRAMKHRAESAEYAEYQRLHAKWAASQIVLDKT